MARVLPLDCSWPTPAEKGSAPEARSDDAELLLPVERKLAAGKGLGR
jgi:hypothetical protein